MIGSDDNDELKKGRWIIMMKSEANKVIKRGQVYIADLGNPVGSEQGGVRPVLIVQNDKGNQYSGTVTIVPLTGSTTKNNIPTHISLKGESFLSKESTALVEQIRTIDVLRLKKCVGFMSDHIMNEIDDAISLQTGLKPKKISIKRFKMIYRPQQICAVV